MGIRDAQDKVSLVKTPAPLDDEINPLQLPEDVETLGCVYLPMEVLLTRHFQFPLKHPRHLDAGMLLQELADTAGIEPNEWWLTWRAKQVESGIAGMAFGLPKTFQDNIKTLPIWQKTPLVLVDGWQRLSHWLHDMNQTQYIAVVDADAEGVFLGFYQNNVWAGMRRLNADMTDAACQQTIAKEVLWSLQSMGFDAETMPVTGRLTSEIASLLPQTLETRPPRIEQSLSQRHMLNLMLPKPTVTDKQLLNIRHDSWAIRNTSSSLNVWYRPALLAASIGFLWLVLTVANNYQLEYQISAKNEEIITAFHRGLPEQTVIMDALAQLRQAAGGSARTSAQQRITEQLDIISKTFEKKPWQMKELSINDGKVVLAGKVNSLNTLNTIRDELASLSKAEVQVADTDLNGDEVSFRVRW